MDMLAALYSGGKDSTFSIFKMIGQGYKISCLIIIHPCEDDSLLYHYPNNTLLKKIASVLDFPVIEGYCIKNNIKEEKRVLLYTIKKAINEYSIEGIVNGAICSNFQLKIFQHACEKLSVRLYSPIWHINTQEYYDMLFNYDFKFMITSVSAMGLDENWLGKTINRLNYEDLKELSSKYGFNLTFEGGEAETLVLDCPIYKKKNQCQWNKDLGWCERKI